MDIIVLILKNFKFCFKMTYKETNLYIRKELSAYYSENEIIGLSKIIFSDVFKLSSINLLMLENNDFNDENFIILKKIIDRLKNYEPIQYIIGFTEFFNLKFYVNENVLIPRQETEELVNLIIEENKNKENLNILDIGTGSACIAISLAKNISNSKVSAIDVSEDAIDIAKKNALLNDVQVAFIQADMLKSNGLENIANFDIIVSNPPYVTNSEKEFMDKNVLNFEPKLALFVDDDNPLIFYKKITEFASKHLNKKGKLYFEINEQFGSETKELLQNYNFKNIEIIKDINGKNRIVRGNL